MVTGHPPPSEIGTERKKGAGNLYLNTYAKSTFSVFDSSVCEVLRVGAL